MREHADHYETHAIGTFKHDSDVSFIVSAVTFNLVSQVSSVNVTPGILSELRNCSSVSHRPGADARVCGSLWRRTTKDSSLTQEFRWTQNISGSYKESCLMFIRDINVESLRFQCSLCLWSTGSSHTDLVRWALGGKSVLENSALHGLFSSYVHWLLDL